MSAARPAGPAKGRPPAAPHRSAARLAAVQALYEIDLSGASADPVLAEFMARRWRVGGDAATAAPDPALLDDVVRGVTRRRADIDGMIGPALAGEWTVERLEAVLRAILRAGVYELVARGDVPARVVISEYLDVAHAFFAGNEAALVNGVLDRLARVLRPGELKGGGDGGGVEAG